MVPINSSKEDFLEPRFKPRAKIARAEEPALRLPVGERGGGGRNFPRIIGQLYRFSLVGLERMGHQMR